MLTPSCVSQYGSDDWQRGSFIEGCAKGAALKIYQPEQKNINKK